MSDPTKMKGYAATQWNDDRRTAFKTELGALLLKYNVGLSGSFEGDTHDIYNEMFEVFDLSNHHNETVMVLAHHTTAIGPYDLR